jgi:hypothetical protein
LIGEVLKVSKETRVKMRLTRKCSFIDILPLSEFLKKSLTIFCRFLESKSTDNLTQDLSPRDLAGYWRHEVENIPHAALIAIL